MPISLHPLMSYEYSFLVYLPQAHVLENIMELVGIFVGMSRAYGRLCPELAKEIMSVFQPYG